MILNISTFKIPINLFNRSNLNFNMKNNIYFLIIIYLKDNCLEWQKNLFILVNQKHHRTIS